MLLIQPAATDTNTHYVPKNKWDALDFNQIKEETARERAPKLRVWTDKTGKHQTTAKFISFGMGQVKLELEDGKMITVSLDALSEADREYIDERRR
jgi:hypothetical protein